MARPWQQVLAPTRSQGSVGGLGSGERQELGIGPRVGRALPPEWVLPSGWSWHSWWFCMVTSVIDGMWLQVVSLDSGVGGCLARGPPKEEELALLLAGGVMAGCASLSSLGLRSWCGRHWSRELGGMGGWMPESISPCDVSFWMPG